MSDEFLINTYAAQWQSHPDITRLSDGSIVVVWDSLYSEDNGHFYYIGAQRFSSTGEPIGGELLLDSDISGQSTQPSIVALADGGYAVAWETAAGDFVSGESDIWTRSYDADGTPRGASVRVHPPHDRNQFAPDLAATADGGYIITWSNDVSADSADWTEVYARTFGADGRATSGVRHVNQLGEYDQDNSKATTLADGRVLITWESQNAGLPHDTTVDAVRGRFYSAAGRPLGDEFMVVAHNDGMSTDGTPGTGTSVDVAALHDGGFVVSWEESNWVGGDLEFQIRAQRYAADGGKVGKEIPLWSVESGSPYASAVEALDGGGFVVAWTAYGDGRAYQEVYAQVFDDDGRALGRHFKVNVASYDYADQELPEIQALDDGGFMIVYESEYLDGEDDAIAGRVFGQGTNGADREAMGWTGAFRALAGNDTITGTSGADSINLGTGNDSVKAGAGADTLIGGLGADRLNGGAGADRFVYTDVAHSLPNAMDTILRFESGRDRIDLARIDADQGARGNQSFAWIGDAAFSGKAGELRFANGQLAGDTNGDGTADFAIKITGDAVVPADLLF
jgi:hypothetical protein